MNMTRDEALQEVKMYQSNDWDLVEETPEFFLLRRSQHTFIGHVIVFVVLGWWTLGIANLVYWLINRKKKKILK